MRGRRAWSHRQHVRVQHGRQRLRHSLRRDAAASALTAAVASAAIAHAIAAATPTAHAITVTAQVRQHLCVCARRCVRRWRPRRIFRGMRLWFGLR